jgi:hypothetical protein
VKKLIAGIISVFVIFLSYPNIGPQGFLQFPNDYFVETGTYAGNGIQRALEVGYKQIWSIEIDSSKVAYVKKRFANYINVFIVQGSSTTDLWELIKPLNGRITFWLDAHIYPPLPNGKKNCPLLEELDQIKKHPIKDHTILIDDMHCCGLPAFDGLTKEDLITKIKEINSDYVIAYIPGGDKGEYPQNVMVAYIP